MPDPKPEQPRKGHAQVQVVTADGFAPKRVPLGFWDSTWDQHRGEEWHGQLFSAFRSSMNTLQRHEQYDTDAALAKSRGEKAIVPDAERVEYRHLSREMDSLENIDLHSIKIGLAAARSKLSPFAAPIDKTDVDGATQRAEMRQLLRQMEPMQRLAALRGDVDEVTAAAILSAPASSSGLSADQYQHFREQRLRRRHPEKLAALEAADAATALVARCLDAARTSTRTRIAPFLPPVEPESKPSAPPWVA
jgi:hypothetical protein